MSIVYPLSLPTVTGIRSINLRARNAVGLSRSPFTFKEQVFSHGGQMLEAEINLPPMTRAEGEQWVSFLIKLKGMQGTFLLGDPAAATPRGSAASTPGTPVVSGAGQIGDGLAISGLPADVDGYIIKRLYEILVVEQLVSSITGAVTKGFSTKAPAKGLTGDAIGGSVQRGVPYMVGERGKEVFVPHSAGSIVPNNQLGGDGGGTVVQNINISTGVSQTVRAEITQLMPQIAEASKAAVLDARRRGGSFSKAF